MSTSLSLIDSHGLIFYSLPYQDDHLILHVFTEKAGLIKVFIRNGIKYKKQQLYAPFYELDWLFKPSKTELYYPKESTLISQNLHLRKDFSLLQSASQWLQAIKQTHPFGRTSAFSYRLLTFFLGKLNNLSHLESIKACFYLKLLKKEGLIPSNYQCFRCHAKEALFLTSQGLCCPQHMEDQLPFFDETQSKQCLFLANVQDWQALLKLPPLSAEEGKRIKSFFDIQVSGP